MSEHLQGLNIKSRLKFLLRDSVVYGGAGAVSKLFAIFTFPILSRHFTIGDYGVVDAITVLSGILITFLVFGQDSAVARLFYEFEGTKDKKNIVTQSLIIQLGFGILAIPLLLFFSDLLSQNYTGSTKYKPIINLIIYQIPFGVFINFATNILKWDFKKHQFLFIQLGSTFSYLISLIIAIYFFSLGIKDIFIILFIVRVAFCIFGLYFIRHWFYLNFKKLQYKALLNIAVPYGFICVLTSLLPALDRMYIAKYLTPEDLGFYAVGYKLAFLMMLPINAFQTAWGPFSYAIYKNSDADKTYNTVLLAFTVFICFLGLGISLIASPLIAFVAGAKYEAAYQTVTPLVFGLIFMSLSWIIGIGIDLSKKTFWKIVSTTLQLIVTIGVIQILVIPFGIQGVAIGILSGYFAYFIWEIYISNKLYKINFSFLQCFTIIGIALLISILGQKIMYHSQLVNMLIYVILLALFVWFSWRIFIKEFNIQSLKSILR